MQWAAPILKPTSVAVTNASSSLLWLKTQPGRQEGLAGQACGNGPWETGDKTRCHLGHARDIPPLGGPTAESGLSQVLALPATKLHSATQMSWLWELKHTSCPFLATRLHARTQESARPYGTVQEPQVLGLREAGAGRHEQSKPDPDRNAFGSIFCQSGLCCAHKVSEHMAVLATQATCLKEPLSQCLAPQGSRVSGCLDSMLGSPRSLSGFLPGHVILQTQQAALKPYLTLTSSVAWARNTCPLL